MARVLIVANADKPRALTLAADARKQFTALGVEAYVSTDRNEDLSRYQANMVVIFGGDGTVLGAISTLGPVVPAILAFNTGHLGYLAENPPERMGDIFREAMEGTLYVSRRMMIEGSITSDRRTWIDYALNEFVLSYRQSRRQLPMSVRVDGEDLMDLRGDGMIIATPTGSTAYSLSAGGPVASPELGAIILTPLCPHQLANRSLVLNPGEVVTIVHYGDNSVELTADGRYCLDVRRTEELTVRISTRQVSFLYEARGRYRLLREKLGWGWSGISVRC